MVYKWLKIAKKQNNKEVILETIRKILIWDFVSLDVIKLIWKPWYFRCRIGKLRIIFFKKDNKYIIDTLWYRGDIYK